MTKLQEMLANKRGEVETQKQIRPLAAIQHEAGTSKPPLNFLAALTMSRSRPDLIAECKRASPSRGILAEDLDPPSLARIYAEGFKVVGLKKLFMSKVEAEGFYYVHKERPFFGGAPSPCGGIVEHL